MSQDDSNEREWSNPDNWSGGFYFSKKDSRVLVPKRIKTLGWTINLGQKKGAAYMKWIFIGGILFVVLTNVVVLKLIVGK